jgi:DeoR family transcriptional regulator, ulaG and ulaABCDEF operon transcriptional repressor
VDNHAKTRGMHPAQRDAEIARLLNRLGFISFDQLRSRLGASSATIRRDLERLDAEGMIERVHGGARLRNGAKPIPTDRLVGAPFEENKTKHALEKVAIGCAAAKLCERGEAIIIDGGTTTAQMCAYLEGLNLQVLTNSLHIVSELLPQRGAKVSVPGGAVFREQNIILSPFEDDGINRYYASKLFMGAAAIGPRGLMQADVVLIQAEQKLMDKADQLIVLVDASKFRSSAAFVVCGLDKVDVVVTDEGVRESDLELLSAHNIEVVIAK